MCAVRRSWASRSTSGSCATGGWRATGETARGTPPSSSTHRAERLGRPPESPGRQQALGLCSGVELARTNTHNTKVELAWPISTYYKYEDLDRPGSGHAAGHVQLRRSDDCVEYDNCLLRHVLPTLRAACCTEVERSSLSGSLATNRRKTICGLIVGLLKHCPGQDSLH